MTFREWMNKHGTFTGLLLLIVLIAVLVGSFVFTRPDHLQGTVLEKIYVPSKIAVGDTPYGGVRRGKYIITAVREEQWIAIVRTDNGDTLTVHLHPDHYGIKNLGDQIKFRDYEGSLIHIEYFAFREEEGDRD